MPAPFQHRPNPLKSNNNWTANNGLHNFTGKSVIQNIYIYTSRYHGNISNFITYLNNQCISLVQFNLVGELEELWIIHVHQL
jgi:hypothetical protein